MATLPDPVFVQRYEWFRESVTYALDSTPWPNPADKVRTRKQLWQLLGRIDADNPPPADNASHKIVPPKRPAKAEWRIHRAPN